MLKLFLHKVNNFSGRQSVCVLIDINLVRGWPEAFYTSGCIEMKDQADWLFSGYSILFILLLGFCTYLTNKTQNVNGCPQIRVVVGFLYCCFTVYNICQAINFKFNFQQDSEWAHFPASLYLLKRHSSDLLHQSYATWHNQCGVWNFKLANHLLHCMWYTYIYMQQSLSNL